MITLTEYVGPHFDCDDWTDECQDNADRLLDACADLQRAMEDAGVHFPTNPITGSGISGQTYGGFRPQTCRQGAPNSSHKEGLAVDLYDPKGEIDAFLMKHLEWLVTYGIYIEHPSATTHWSHWSIKPPRSGLHVFHP